MLLGSWLGEASVEDFFELLVLCACGGSGFESGEVGEALSAHDLAHVVLVGLAESFVVLAQASRFRE